MVLAAHLAPEREHHLNGDQKFENQKRTKKALRMNTA